MHGVIWDIEEGYLVQFNFLEKMTSELQLER